jgi:ubiquinone/menaquinone biosynthesis C-methylase UbiE
MVPEIFLGKKIMQPKFNSESEFMRWNEDMAQKYDPEAYHLRSNFLIRWIERRRVKEIIKLLDINQHNEVLEVGCGAGNVLEKIPSTYLHGIDLSSSLLIKSKYRLAKRSASLILANAENLPYPRNYFTRLFCSEVLEHVVEPAKVINEMIRVAQPDALFVISVPNEKLIDWVKNMIRKFHIDRWLMKGNQISDYTSPNKMTDEWHLHSFDIHILRALLEPNLKIRIIKSIPFKIFPLRYVVQCVKRKNHTNHLHYP